MKRIEFLLCVGLFVYLILGEGTTSLAGEKQKKNEENGFFEKTGGILKRGAKKIKKAGKKLGEEVQEVFDPEDEDLKKKPRESEREDD